MLLLDEPLGALDLKLRKGLQVELKRIQRDVGITFVYVTHDQEEALTMSDRIAVMNRGRVEQVGVARGRLRAPATTFVAGFIGVSNLMPGEVVAGRTAASSRVRLDAGVEIEAPANGLGQRRALPRGRPPGEARRLDAPATARSGRRRLAERRGDGRELGLPRDRDPDRRQAGRGRPDDGPGPERGRGRARAAARRRRPGAPLVGARAHPRGQGVRGTGTRSESQGGD